MNSRQTLKALQLFDQKLENNKKFILEILLHFEFFIWLSKLEYKLRSTACSEKFVFALVAGGRECVGAPKITKNTTLIC
jgi:hypothetical protein